MGRSGKKKALFGTCPFCSNGLMILDDDGLYYECSDCGHSIEKDKFLFLLQDPLLDAEAIGDESYEEVYDDDGFGVTCSSFFCRGKIKFKDGKYICTKCGDEMSRDDFFNYIGATPLGPECSNCNQNFPNCIVCPYGYKN